MAEALDRLGRPAALTIKQLREAADEPLAQWFADHKVMVRRRMAGSGYEKVGNPNNPRSGSWSVEGKPAIIYVRRELGLAERGSAVEALTAASRRSGGRLRKPFRASLGSRVGPSKTNQTPLSRDEPAATAQRPLGQSQ